MRHRASSGRLIPRPRESEGGMNRTESGQIAVGAPNSVARYLAETPGWGNNKWAVFEYCNGKFLLRAAQTSRSRAEQYMKPGYLLVDTVNGICVSTGPTCGAS